MRNVRSTAMLFVATLVAASPALGQKGGGGGGGGTTTPTYYRDWNNVCGGTSFVTCASVRLKVSGTSVTMQAWNLSGGLLGGHAGSVISNIALLNVPGGVSTMGGTGTAGSYYTPPGAPAYFSITETNSTTPTSSTGKIALNKSSATVSGSTPENEPLMHGLASSCAATTPGLIPSGTRLWMTKSDGCDTSQLTTTNGLYSVTFNFSLNQAFDPNAANVQLGITAVDMTSPLVTSYYEAYATPEPASMILLGSGLLGLGGAAARRRRREREQSASLA